MTIDLTPDQAATLRYLLDDALSGWGEPFKDLEDVREPDKEARAVLRKLKAAAKEKP